MCFFPRVLESLPPLPRQHSAAIGCTKSYQPIGVTVHSHCVESFEGLLQRCRLGRGCSELWKTQFFLNTLYMKWNDRWSYFAWKVSLSLVNFWLNLYQYILLNLENNCWNLYIYYIIQKPNDEKFKKKTFYLQRAVYY